MRRPYLLAHRGASGYAPENTMAAFDQAVGLKADGIETDVRASRDGVLVLMHDQRVDRVTDGEGAVADLTFDQLRRLDSGASFNARFAGQRIARLDELLERHGGRRALCLELKQPGLESRLIDAVENAGLLRPIPKANGLPRDQLPLPPVSFTSFSFDSCLALARLAPKALIGFLTQSLDDLTIKRTADAGLRQICPRADACTSERIVRARERGLGVRAWAVTDREVLRQAVEAGVDGLTCNWPDWTLAPTR